MEQVSVNEYQSRKTGLVLNKYGIRPSFYNREFLSFQAVREIKLRVYLFSAAICHQTYSLVNTKKNLYGWDFMEYAFLQMAKQKSFLFNELSNRPVTNEEVKNLLSLFFSHDGKPQHCTLDTLDERAEMLTEICNYTTKHYNGSIEALIDSCNNKLYDSGKGIYELLGQFAGFKDPWKKKITFFLKLASDARVLHISDTENIIPIMDYHMQRVLMRLGCVEINDKELHRNLTERNPVATDSPVREACIKSIKIISEFSEQGILKMNDFFWPLGRSCCNENPLCIVQTCEKNPCTFFEVVELTSHEKCIFEEVCKASSDMNYRKLWQPVVKTDFY